LAVAGHLYDPRVRARIEAAAPLAPDALARLREARAATVSGVAVLMSRFDALLPPTVPLVAPTVAVLDKDGALHPVKPLLLRNPTVVNFIDGCAVSLPCQLPGEAPVGTMIAGLHGADVRILSVARAIEPLLRW